MGGGGWGGTNLVERGGRHRRDAADRCEFRQQIRRDLRRRTTRHSAQSVPQQNSELNVPFGGPRGERATAEDTDASLARVVQPLRRLGLALTGVLGIDSLLAVVRVVRIALRRLSPAPVTAQASCTCGRNTKQRSEHSACLFVCLRRSESENSGRNARGSKWERARRDGSKWERAKRGRAQAGNRGGEGLGCDS